MRRPSAVPAVCLVISVLLLASAAVALVLSGSAAPGERAAALRDEATLMLGVGLALLALAAIARGSSTEEDDAPNAN